MTILIQFDGNLTSDPELRFTPSGAAVANFTVAHTPRRFDKQANEWRDDETVFLRCTCWQEMAEHVSETLTRGMSVMVSGKLGARTWETKEGQKRTDFEVTVDNIGPSLKRATAKVTKSERSSSPALSGNVVGADDPWATQTTTVSSAGYPRQSTGWGAPADTTEPPF